MAAPPPVSIPTNPEDGVDESHDLNPGSPVDKKRLDSLISERPNASELQEKGILKGMYGAVRDRGGTWMTTLWGKGRC